MRHPDPPTSPPSNSAAAARSPRGDENAIEAHVRKHGVTVLPPGQARGIGGNRATASGVASPEAFVFRPGKHDALSAETRIAKGKLLIMFEDLAGCSRGATPSRREKMRNDARRWFFGEGDFEAWCDAAGYAPEIVRGRAREVEVNGKDWEWLAPAGKGKNYEKRKASRTSRAREP